MRRISAVITLLVVCGCIPVPTVLLRDASALPSGQTTQRQAGGVEWYSGNVLNDDNYESEGFLPYYSMFLVRGIGRRSDLTAGFANAQGFVGARYQLLGTPGQSIGFCVSLDAGGSATLGAAQLLELADLHLGANVSLGGNERSFYLSYRHHWVTAIPPDNTSPSDEFRQHALFLGLSMHGGVKRGGLAGIEIFHTWPDDRSETLHSVLDTWGANLCFPLN